MKPVAFGMVHDENNGPLIAELVIGSHNFTRLLFNVLEDYGLDLKQVRRPGSHKKLWEEMEDIKQIRNKILHSGGAASRDAAEISLEIAIMLLRNLYPELRKCIVGE